MSARKACPTCGRIRLDADSMRGLLAPLTLFTQGRVSLAKLQDFINEAVMGENVHLAALTHAERALRMVKEEGGLTTAQIAERIGASSGTVQVALYRQRAKGRVRSTGTKPIKWWWKR